MGNNNNNNIYSLCIKNETKNNIITSHEHDTVYIRQEKKKIFSENGSIIPTILPNIDLLTISSDKKKYQPMRNNNVTTTTIIQPKKIKKEKITTSGMDYKENREPNKPIKKG